MYDVGVLGVGSMGSMTLWQLARRGVRAIGFEQFSVGHDRGAAGGETRISAPPIGRAPSMCRSSSGRAKRGGISKRTPGPVFWT